MNYAPMMMMDDDDDGGGGIKVSAIPVSTLAE